MNVIETINLTKEYNVNKVSGGKISALNKFTFKVQQGEIFGLLGPNGAGKTTLIKILLGIVFSTEGEFKIFDKEIKDDSYKKRVGYLPENHKFPNYLTGEQVLDYYGKLSGMESTIIKKRTSEYLAFMGIEKWKKTKIKKYSKGMLQRMGLAQALMNDPDLIFLDEPTDGVDPIARKTIRDMLLDLKSRGKTIFINSHLLSEVEQICDRVAILNKGTLIKEGLIDEITGTSDQFKIITSEFSEEIYNKLLNDHRAVMHSHNEFLFKTDSVEDLNKIIDLLRSSGVLIHNISKDKNTLEELFINVIGNQTNVN
jgi:ABC-2 type transport system ATP-binding protein